MNIDHKAATKRRCERPKTHLQSNVETLKLKFATMKHGPKMIVQLSSIIDIVTKVGGQQ